MFEQRNVLMDIFEGHGWLEIIAISVNKVWHAMHGNGMQGGYKGKGKGKGKSKGKGKGKQEESWEESMQREVQVQEHGTDEDLH